MKGLVNIMTAAVALLCFYTTGSAGAYPLSGQRVRDMPPDMNLMQLHFYPPIYVDDSPSLESAVATAFPGAEIILRDGVYNDVKLIVRESGTRMEPIFIHAEHPGKVEFSGDVRVELRGEHIILADIVFRNGRRDPSQWRSHGPGLVAIYGSHNRVTGCLFHMFDTAVSAWITTSLDEEGRAPQYCRIDHCAFIEKTTRDQVINLNNTPRKSEEGEPGIPMYHRVDHCYFSNPPKIGNAGGGIRVGYWRKDYGRCLVDHNLFERQDSEGEVITSKSTENLYLANTLLNCRGTLNFRHGDRQAALHNFFIGTDTRFQYGGMFVWGSGHLIGCNYFSLPAPLRQRGRAAISLNPGPEGSEHALAYDITIAGNVFSGVDGYDVNLSPLYQRRVDAFGDATALPRDIRFVGNIFSGAPGCRYPVIHDEFGIFGDQKWIGNYYSGKETGFAEPVTGLEQAEIIFRRHGGIDYPVSPVSDIEAMIGAVKIIKFTAPEIDFTEELAKGICGAPLTRQDVGPRWCGGNFPGTYQNEGIVSPEVQRQFDEITLRGDHIE